MIYLNIATMAEPHKATRDDFQALLNQNQLELDEHQIFEPLLSSEHQPSGKSRNTPKFWSTESALSPSLKHEKENKSLLRS
jgi:hypothetical protein